MKRFLSTHYSAGAFNTAMLLLRLVAGGFIVLHGYDKLVNFEQTSSHMMSFLGMGSKASTALLVFAEFFCGLLVIIGLFTRLACIPLVIAMGVAFFRVHHMVVTDYMNPGGGGQPSGLFLMSFLVLLLTGAGRVSVDSMIGK